MKPLEPQTVQTREYHSYLLRLWQSGNAEPHWHAILERIADGERRGFANLDQLIAFLREQTGEIDQDTIQL